MENLLNKSLYTIDLSKIDTIPEIIFELSSVLEEENAKNRCICLKLGNIDLNQAQLLSIKSLINGIGSSLSYIDTKSALTEKTALSLGLIVSEENYNTKNNSNNSEEQNFISEEIKEETPSVEAVQAVIENESEADKTVDEDINEETFPQQQVNITENFEQEQEKHSTPNELDMIFGLNSSNSPIFQEDLSLKNIEEDKITEAEKSEQLYGTEDVVQGFDTGLDNEYTKEDIEIEEFPTKYIKQTVRSGQVINYEGNIVIIGDSHSGSEIIAGGDITVWGVLSGIAHAGLCGNKKARIRALKMNAIQLRIADFYSRRPDFLNSIYAEKTNSFTPEEARVVNGEIVVFKIND